MLDRKIKKGMLVFYKNDREETISGVQRSGRPYLVVSNDKFNEFSPVVNRIPLSSKTTKNSPVHIFISQKYATGLKCNSVLLCEQISTIQKNMCTFVGWILNENVLKEVDKKLVFQFNMFS